MATKNILFKISADIGNLEAQLERVAQRIDQLGENAAKSGQKIKEGLEKGVDDKKYDQYVKDQERARSKAIIQEREKLLRDIEKEEQKKVKVVSDAAKKEVDAAKKANDDKIKLELGLTKIKEQEATKRLIAANKLASQEARYAKEAADKAAKAAQEAAQNNRIDLGTIIKGGLAVAGINSAVQALKDFTSEAIRSAAEFQKNQIAFKTFIGSGEQANKVLRELVQLAIKTPFTSEETINAARVLAAYGFSATQLVPIVQRLGNIAAGTTIPLSQIGLVFGQIKAAGKLMGQDLLQLVNAGFNPLQEISERTGESMANLRKRMGEGKISFEEVQASIIRATESGGRFYELNQQLAETTAGKLDQLKEKWQLFTRETGTALEPFTKKVLEFGENLIELGRSVTNFFTRSGIGGVIKGFLELVDNTFKRLKDLVDFASSLLPLQAPALEKPTPATKPNEMVKGLEDKQVDAITKTNDELRKQIDLLKSSGEKTASGFKYNTQLVDDLNKKLDKNHQINKQNIIDKIALNQEAESAYLQLTKLADQQSKIDLYTAINEGATKGIEADQKLVDQIKKDWKEMTFWKVGAYGIPKPITDENEKFLESRYQISFLEKEILEYKKKQWDAGARLAALTIEQGGNTNNVKEKVQKIVDLYVQLRKLAEQVKDKQLTEFRGKDETTQLLVSQKKYDLELERIEKDRAERIKELQKEKLSELQSTDEKAVLSAANNAEIISIVEGELYSRRIMAEIDFNNRNLDITDKFNEEKRKANEDSLKLDYKNEEEYWTDRISLYNDFIEQTKKLAEKAKTGKQFRTQIGILNQEVSEQNRNIDKQRQAKIQQLNIEEDALALRRNLAGASAEELGQIEKDYADKREKVNKDADAAIAKNSNDATQFLIDQQKIRRDAVIDGWSKVISEIQNVSQTVTDEIIRQTDVLISEQQKRVDKAKDIADKGNAEFLQREEERLTKLNEKRARAARTANAIAKSEAVAQAALAVAKAAGETGAGAPFAIASTLIALAAGLATAYSSISSNNFDKGGYTGDGGKYEPAGTVHKGEFVFTKEKTTKYRKLFEEIHAGRTPGLVEGYGEKVIVINNNMNDRLERIERAILSQNRMQVSIDEKGIHGIVSRIDYNNKRINSRF